MQGEEKNKKKIRKEKKCKSRHRKEKPTSFSGLLLSGIKFKAKADHMKIMDKFGIVHLEQQVSRSWKPTSYS